MNSNNWYIITGAPNSGKSTLIKLLASNGYRTIDEAARIYIDKEIARGKELKNIRNNEISFQKKILEIKIELERKIPKEDIVFWDRGIPDSDAYYKLQGIASDVNLKKAIENSVYKKVFLLDYLPYKKDYSRTESKGEQIKLHGLLKDVYEKINIPMVEVSKMNSVEERLKFILNNL
ncbi:MAG: ATP-binding protein [Candidatus Pacebacteria bacterium]|nr:ATP-binding protein [Candidatus Paceibacterota bacterium]